MGTLYDPLRRAQKVSYLASSLVGLDQGAAAQVRGPLLLARLNQKKKSTPKKIE